MVKRHEEEHLESKPLAIFDLDLFSLRFGKANDSHLHVVLFWLLLVFKNIS